MRLIAALLSAFVLSLGSVKADQVTFSTEFGFSTKWIGPDFGYLVTDRPVFWTNDVASWDNGLFVGTYYRWGADYTAREGDVFGGWKTKWQGLDVRFEATYFSFSAYRRSISDAVSTAAVVAKSVETRVGKFTPYVRLEPWFLLNGHTAFAGHIGVRHELELIADVVTFDHTLRLVAEVPGVFGDSGTNWSYTAGLVWSIGKDPFDGKWTWTIPQYRYLDQINKKYDGRGPYSEWLSVLKREF